MTDDARKRALIERLKAQAAAHRYMAETDSASLLDEAIAALSSAAPSAAEPVAIPDGFMLISDQQIVALEMAEAGMRAVAIKQRQIGDVIEPVRTINDAAKIAKAAADRVWNVIHCLDLNTAPPAPQAASGALTMAEGIGKHGVVKQWPNVAASEPASVAREERKLIQHLLDDIVEEVDQEGVTHYRIADGKDLMFSNLVYACARLPQAADVLIPEVEAAVNHAKKCRSYAVRLFNETPPEVSLTEAGDRLLYAAQLLDLLAGGINALKQSESDWLKSQGASVAGLSGDAERKFAAPPAPPTEAETSAEKANCVDPMCACRGGPCAECSEGEREKELSDLRQSLGFYQRRVELLQQWQSRMRDPERTIVCDIIANGQTLPDTDGSRYGRADAPVAEPVALTAKDAKWCCYGGGVLRKDCDFPCTARAALSQGGGA